MNIIKTEKTIIEEKMKKAGKFFSDMVSKSKQMFNQPKDKSPADNKNDDDDFDSGEDDDLIEIGKHKGAGAKSLFQNLESLTGNQIIQEDKYAQEFKQQSSGAQKSQAAKNEIDFVREAIEKSFSEAYNPDEESKEQAESERIRLTKQTSFFSLSTFEEIENSLMHRNSQSNQASGSEDTKYFEFVCVVGFHHSVGS